MPHEDHIPWNLTDDWDPDDLRDACCFPGECLLAGPHSRHDCHTVEMLEAWEAEEHDGTH